MQKIRENYFAKSILISDPNENEKDSKFILENYDQLAHLLTHEINNPLQSINNYIFDLIKKIESNHEVTIKLNSKEYFHLKEILSQNQRIGEVTNSLLQIVDINKESKNIFNLKEVILRTLQELQEKLLLSQITVELNFPNEDIFIFENVSSFNIILHNILENSIDAIDRKYNNKKKKKDQKLIKILVKSLYKSNFNSNSKTDDSLTLYRKKGYNVLESTNKDHSQMVKLTIIDDGLGMNLNVLENIFQPFFSTKKTKEKKAIPGSGLGMTIVKYLLKQNGGDIEIMTMENVETIVNIYFPVINSFKNKTSKADIFTRKKNIKAPPIKNKNYLNFYNNKEQVISKTKKIEPLLELNYRNPYSYNINLNMSKPTPIKKLAVNTLLKNNLVKHTLMKNANIMNQRYLKQEYHCENNNKKQEIIKKPRMCNAIGSNRNICFDDNKSLYQPILGKNCQNFLGDDNVSCFHYNVLPEKQDYDNFSFNYKEKIMINKNRKKSSDMDFLLEDDYPIEF